MHNEVAGYVVAIIEDGLTVYIGADGDSAMDTYACMYCDTQLEARELAERLTEEGYDGVRVVTVRENPRSKFDEVYTIYRNEY